LELRRSKGTLDQVRFVVLWEQKTEKDTGTDKDKDKDKDNKPSRLPVFKLQNNPGRDDLQIPHRRIIFNLHTNFHI
jgi:hypothetical protein